MIAGLLDVSEGAKDTLSLWHRSQTERLADGSVSRSVAVDEAVREIVQLVPELHVCKNLIDVTVEASDAPDLMNWGVSIGRLYERVYPMV